MTNSKDRKHRRRFKPATAAEIALAAVLICILALIAAGFIPLSHPRLARAAVALLRKTGADSCSAGKVSVAFWKGVTISDLRLAGAAGAERRYSLSARSAIIRANLFRAWLGSGGLREAFRKRHRQPAGGGLQRQGRLFPAPPGSVPGYVSGAALEGVSVGIYDSGKTLLSAAQVSCSMQFTEKNGRNVEGTLSAPLLAAGQAGPLRQLKAGFSWNGAVLTLTSCRGKLLDGRVRFEARADLSRGALSSLACSLDGFTLDSLNRFITGGGRLAGSGNFRIALDSSLLCADSLRGKGTVSVANLEVAGFPFQQELVGMLQYPGLNRLHFKKFFSDVAIKPGRTISTEARGDGDSLSIKASGWVRPDGRLDERLDCTLSKEAAAALSEFARKTLPDAPGGGKNVKLRIFGKIDKPKVEIETKAILQKAVQNLFDDVRNNIMQWLR